MIKSQPIILLKLISWNKDGIITAQFQHSPFHHIRRHITNLIIDKKIFFRFNHQDRNLIKEFFKIYDERDMLRNLQSKN